MECVNGCNYEIGVISMAKMTATEYMHIQNRICNYYKTCFGCPVYKKMYKNQPCIVWICDNFEEFTSIIRQWAEEHPEKTMLQDLLEKYPNTLLDDGIPRFCPHNLGYKKCEPDFCSSVKCKICKNRTLEE